MASPSDIRSQARSGGPALTGSWKLAAGHAITLMPPQPGEVLVARGRAWATLDGPHARREGDLFLEAGARLSLAAGQRVVIEPWGCDGDAPLWFSWVPSRAAATSPVQRALVQPLADLRLALASVLYAARGAAQALARLAWGLAVLGGTGLRWPLRRRPPALG